MSINSQVIQLFDYADQAIEDRGISGPPMLKVFLDHQEDEPELVAKVLAGEFDDIEDELNEWLSESLNSIYEMNE